MDFSNLTEAKKPRYGSSKEYTPVQKRYIIGIDSYVVELQEGYEDLRKNARPKLGYRMFVLDIRENRVVEVLIGVKNFKKVMLGLFKQYKKGKCKLVRGLKQDQI